MEINLRSEAVTEYRGDAVLVGVQQEAPLPGHAAGLDARLDGMISRLVSAGEVRGKPGEVTILHTWSRLPAERVALVGLGTPAQTDLLAVRRAVAAGVRALRNRGCRRVGVPCPVAEVGTRRAGLSVRAVVEAVYGGLYRGEELKSTRDQLGTLEELGLLGLPPEATEHAARAVRAGRAAGEATNYARRLVNLPGNEVTPDRLAQEALVLGRDVGLEVEVLERDRLEELGMRALLAVGGASEHPPRLIVLRHAAKEATPQVAFVGKGLTFDSGGISIKHGEDLHLMKGDMAGAAAVLSAMRAAAELGLELNLVGLIPTAENVLGGRAYRPGDVLTAFGGKTVEVISTDAEGRLILAEALGYACQLGATHLVDVATLTGACIIALGNVAAGVMGNDDGLVEAVLDAAETAGERAWRLPLFPEYRQQLQSTIADLKNVGGRPAGAITGGLFLQEFVGDVPWVHLDIAGTAWSEKDEPHQVEGATGAGTRTLLALAERLAGAAIA